MRILVFNQFYARPSEPGIGRFHLFGVRWVRTGHKVTVVTGNRNYLSGERTALGLRLWRSENDQGIGVVRVWSSTLGFSYHSFPGRVFTYLTFFKTAFWAGFFREKPDVVIASSPPIFLGILAYFLSRLKGATFVFEVRDLWPDELIELGGLKSKTLISLCFFLERFFYSRADRIMVNSPGLKDFLVREKKVSKEKIGVAENPVEFTNSEKAGVFKTADGKILGKGDFTVFYGGNHGRVYDFDTLLTAAKELEAEGRRIFFVLMGGGKQRAAVLERVKGEKTGNVILISSAGREEFLSYLGAASVCVVPLKKLRLIKNVYATKILECMALGKPIVLLMEGVSRDLVEKAGCGITLLPGDKDGMKKALLDLAEHPEKARVFGERGRRYAREHFFSETLADRYVSEIEKAGSVRPR